MSIHFLGRSFASTRTVLTHITPDQLEEPTPCRSWTVRALLHHVIHDPYLVATAVSTGESTAPEDDFGEGDFVAHYDATARRTVEAFDLPGVLERVVKVPFGEFPGALLMSLVATDQFVHGWDLARATGQATDLDPELANEFLSQTQGWVTDDLRGKDGIAPFGPACEAPAEACPADRLAAFLGRSV